jgi:predicted MFS family arabinose efflux permease
VKAWPAYKTIAGASTDYATALAATTAAGRQFNAAKYLMPADDVHHLMQIFLVTAAVIVVVGVITGFFITFPPAEQSSATATDLTTADAIGDARFYVLWAMLFLNVFGGVMVISAATPIIAEITSQPLAAATGIYTAVAWCNGLGRFLFGALSDVIGRRLTFVAIFSLQAASFMLLDASHDPGPVAVAIAMMLLAYGGGFGTMPSTNADMFGTKNFGTNYGAMISAWGLAAVAGAYAIAQMKAFSGSYVGMMQPISILGLVALFFPMIIESPRRKAAERATKAAAA